MRPSGQNNCNTLIKNGGFTVDLMIWPQIGTRLVFVLSSLRSCIFTNTCSILNFLDVLKSYDPDSFISGNNVPTRDPKVTPYYKILKMCVFKKCFIFMIIIGGRYTYGTPIKINLGARRQNNMGTVSLPLLFSMLLISIPTLYGRLRRVGWGH